MNRRLYLIAHNLRSCHNVGALLRTADGLGIEKVYLTGYSPYPSLKTDPRLPHLKAKIDRQIHKTALGAENTVSWEHHSDVTTVLKKLSDSGVRLCALEQAVRSKPLQSYHAPKQLALIVGREVEGLEPEILKLVDDIVQIPMLGKKESFNVVQASAMGLYHMRFVA